MNTHHLSIHVDNHLKENYPTVDASQHLYERFLREEFKLEDDEIADKLELWLNGNSPEEQGYSELESEQYRFYIWYYLNIIMAEIRLEAERNTVSAWSEDLDGDKVNVIILEDFDKTNFDSEDEEQQRDILEYNGWWNDLVKYTDEPHEKIIPASEAPDVMYFQKCRGTLHPVKPDGKEIDLDTRIQTPDMSMYKQTGHNNNFMKYEIRPKFKGSKS